IAAWVYLDNKTADHSLISKWQDPTSREYILLYDHVADVFKFGVSPDGATYLPGIITSTVGSPATGIWYYIVAWHDSVNNTLNLQINNGAVDSRSYSSGVYNGTAVFSLGSR